MVTELLIFRKEMEISNWRSLQGNTVRGTVVSTTATFGIGQKKVTVVEKFLLWELAVSWGSTVASITQLPALFPEFLFQ